MSKVVPGGLVWASPTCGGWIWLSRGSTLRGLESFLWFRYTLWILLLCFLSTAWLFRLLPGTTLDKGKVCASQESSSNAYHHTWHWMWSRSTVHSHFLRRNHWLILAGYLSIRCVTQVRFELAEEIHGNGACKTVVTGNAMACVLVEIIIPLAEWLGLVWALEQPLSSYLPQFPGV